MKITVRHVGESDAREIVELLNPIINAGNFTAMENPMTLKDELDFIRGFPEEGIFLAAVDAMTGRIVGIQDVVPLVSPTGDKDKIGEISTFVSLSATRQGIGSHLSKAMVFTAREKGYGKLLAIIRADNPGAIAFYRGQGFRLLTADTEPEDCRGGTKRKIIMEKLI